MKQVTLITILILFGLLPAWASRTQPLLTDQTSGPVASSPITRFRQHIPAVAEQFVGMPVKLGGNPIRTGTTDNSALFYTIYSAAAQKAGLSYKAYLPMRYLLQNTRPVPQEDVKNGDLIVLNNGLAAMVYRVEASGRMHFIYASKKRLQVIAFHSSNLVYQVYWLEHLKGFVRLAPDMLIPGK